MCGLYVSFISKCTGNEFKDDDKSETKPDSAKEGVGKRRKKVKRLVPKMYINDEGEMGRLHYLISVCVLFF